MARRLLALLLLAARAAAELEPECTCTCLHPSCGLSFGAVERLPPDDLGQFLYRELDDAARRVQLVDDVSGAARLPCPAYGACVYLTSAYSKMAYLRAGTW